MSYGNKIFILSLTLCVCVIGMFGSLSISDVSATDRSVSGTGFDDIQDTIDVSASSGDRVLLGAKTYTGSGYAIRVSGGKNVTIQGQSNTNRATLNANNLQSTLNIDNESSATIRYVNFEKGGSTRRALTSHGTVLIENCSFSNCQGDSGSAIYIANPESSNSIIRYCNFTNNHAFDDTNNDFASGGAVCIDCSDNFLIENCYFGGNRALTYGGALTIRNHSANAKVINCSFVNNYVDELSGGAINTNCPLIVTGCIFTNNRAIDTGGAIHHMDTGVMIVTDCVFTNNIANNGTGGIRTYAPLSIINCNFTGNRNLNYRGGAIFCGAELNITDSRFISNYARTEGGAVYSNGRLLIKNTVFTGNNATNTGGAIRADGNIEINLSNFTNNHAFTNGGAIYSTSATVINNGIFNNNLANTDAGAIFASASLTVINSTFNGNNATNGGVIRGSNNLAINNCNFTNNKATGNGGVIWTNSNINLNNTIFGNNYAINGGAIWTNDLISIYGTNFTNNRAINGSGGAISGLGATIRDNSIFYNNSATLNGGAIYASNKVVMSDVSFENNKANGNGGSICVYNATDYNDLQHIKFLNNSGANGGAIYSVGIMFIENSIFNNNSASKNGGSIYSTNNLSTGNCSFEYNHASENGGAIFSTRLLNVVEGIFNDNNAYKFGGAIYCNIGNVNVLRYKNISFIRNVAMVGSSIYSCKELNLWFFEFKDNMADGRDLVLDIPAYINISKNSTINATYYSGDNYKQTYVNGSINDNGKKMSPNKSEAENKWIKLVLVGWTKYELKIRDTGFTIFDINTYYGDKEGTYELIVSIDDFKIEKTGFLRLTNNTEVNVSSKRLKDETKISKYIHVVKQSVVNVKPSSMLTSYYVKTVVGKNPKRFSYSFYKNSTAISFIDRYYYTVKSLSYNSTNKKHYPYSKIVSDAISYRVYNITTYTYKNGNPKPIVSTLINKSIQSKTALPVENNIAPYLRSTVDCDPKNPTLVNLVGKIKNNIPKNKLTKKSLAKAIFTWNQKNIGYVSSYTGTRQNSTAILSSKKGNSWEHAHLAIAMFRAAKLPARYVYKANSKGETHVWAQVYLYGEWCGADTTLKSGEMRSNSSWVGSNFKFLDNSKKYNYYVRSNFAFHKNLKLNSNWYAIKRSVKYSDGKKTVKYYLR